jgi:hypothetical protein
MLTGTLLEFLLEQGKVGLKLLENIPGMIFTVPQYAKKQMDGRHTIIVQTFCLFLAETQHIGHIG